ncbi:unnamed protein product [Ixodes pacificus]
MSLAIEYAVFGILMVGNLGLGLYFAFFKRIANLTTDELFLGSRTLKVLPLAISSFASLASSTGIVGFIGHFYAYGFHFSWGAVTCLIVLPVSVFVIIPVLFKLKLTSIFEFVQLPMYLATETTVCALFCSQSHGAVAIFAASVAISTVFQAQLIWCTLAIGLTGTLYTALGGLRGVVWTDCVQAFLSLVAPATIIIKVVVDSYGGTKKLTPLSELNTSVYFLDTSLDFTKDENLWACLIAIVGFHLYFLCLEQMLVQRSMSCRSLKEAQRTSYSGILLMVFFHILRSFTALALIYWYRNCDPLLTGEITKVDQILPFYVSQHLSEFPGFSGIFLAGVVSASTSTVSSAINSIAAVLYVDVISHHFAMTERRAATFTRVMGMYESLC